MVVGWLDVSSQRWQILKRAPLFTEGKERSKKTDHYSTVARSKFNKQGNLFMRFVLRDHKISRSLNLPARIFEVYIEALTGFYPIHSPDGLSNTLLSQGYGTGTVPTVETVGRVCIPRTGEKVRSLWLPRSILQVNRWWSHSLNDLPQHWIIPLVDKILFQSH